MSKPNQHTSVWNKHTEALLIRLREDEDWDWGDIGEVLGVGRDSAAPRHKYRRIKRDPDHYRELRDLLEQDEHLGDHLDEANVDQGTEDFDISTDVTKLKYEYLDGTFIFSVNNQIVKIPETSWEKVVALYSEDGADLTQQQIAMKLGISRKILEACLRAYGHYKARPPVTREALARGDDEETLVSRAIEVKERKFLERLRDKSRRELEREVRSLRQELHERGEYKEELRLFVQDLISDLQGYAPKVRKIVKSATQEVFDAHETLFDPHVGLATFHEMGWTQDYNSDIALEYIRAQGVQAAERIARRPGRCRTIYFSLGGDFFHAPLGKTESGRPLMRDKPDRMLFRSGVEAVIDHVDSLRSVSEKVVVKGVGGNHGHVFDELLVDFLALYYRDVEDVEVDTQMGTRAHFRVGNALHVIDHGTTFHTVTSERSLSRADRIARIVAGTNYHGVERVIFYVGHMHHRESKSQAHIEIIRVPVFCHESEFEDALGFYNEPMADLFILDGRGRIESTERMYLADYEAERLIA